MVVDVVEVSTTLIEICAGGEVYNISLVDGAVLSMVLLTMELDGFNDGMNTAMQPRVSTPPPAAQMPRPSLRIGT
jgi:hypothetical protein